MWKSDVGSLVQVLFPSKRGVGSVTDGEQRAKVKTQWDIFLTFNFLLYLVNLADWGHQTRPWEGFRNSSTVWDK